MSTESTGTDTDLNEQVKQDAAPETTSPAHRLKSVLRKIPLVPATWRLAYRVYDAFYVPVRTLLVYARYPFCIRECRRTFIRDFPRAAPTSLYYYNGLGRTWLLIWHLIRFLVSPRGLKRPLRLEYFEMIDRPDRLPDLSPANHLEFLGLIDKSREPTNQRPAA